MVPKKVLIMGAAGRDFHNFNVVYRHDPAYQVIGFTATQIPNIAHRKYPAELAGDIYPQGIPIFPEAELPSLIDRFHVDEVIFAYSDVSHEYVMNRASLVLSCGADFKILGPHATQLQASKPLIAVCAVRTGCGKSQTTRRVAQIIRRLGYRVGIIRHPMPYGDLVRQKAQRFAAFSDLDLHHCTIEEREEYEPHIESGFTVYAGVDYAAILRLAEAEVDFILWDGGNNDFSFYHPDYTIVVADPHRAGHEVHYHPGETNLRLADVVVINKVDTAPLEGIQGIRQNVSRLNPSAYIIEAASPIFVPDPLAIRGKRVLVVEDGPTLTHGGMSFGAGIIAAQRFGAGEIIDPRPFAVGSILATYAQYPNTARVLPAMGYGEQMIAELETTINRSAADLILTATPIDLNRVLKTQIPLQRVRYELQEIGSPTLEDLLKEKFGNYVP